MSHLSEPALSIYTAWLAAYVHSWRIGYDCCGGFSPTGSSHAGCCSPSENQQDDSSLRSLFQPQEPLHSDSARLLGLPCNLLGTSPGAALLFGFLSDVACGFSATGRFGTMLAISPRELNTCRGSIHILVPWLRCRIPQVWFYEELGPWHCMSAFCWLESPSRAFVYTTASLSHRHLPDFARPPPLLPLLVLWEMEKFSACVCRVLSLCCAGSSLLQWG